MTNTQINPLTAGEMVSQNIAAALAALESARLATTANPADPLPHIGIAEAHIRIAELAYQAHAR